VTDFLLSSIVRACTNCSLVEKAQSRPKSAGPNGPCPKDRRISGKLPSAVSLALTCRAGVSLRRSRVERAVRSQRPRAWAIGRRAQMAPSHPKSARCFAPFTTAARDQRLRAWAIGRAQMASSHTKSARCLSRKLKFPPFTVDSASDRLRAAGMRARACRAWQANTRTSPVGTASAPRSALTGSHHFEFQRDLPACKPEPESGPGGSRASAAICGAPLGRRCGRRRIDGSRCPSTPIRPEHRTRSIGAHTPQAHWQQPKLASGAFWLWYR
jgi:hypothetical protein